MNLRLLLAVCLSAFSLMGATVSDAPDPGKLRFVIRSGSDWDSCCTDNPSAATKQFMETHYWRFQTTPGYFDKDLSWFPNAWGYIDSLAIYNPSSLATQHPDWIIRDTSGNKLFIDWGCGGGTCPQYAADISNQAFRDYWISKAQAIIAAGYKGLWIDDVNLRQQLSDGNGNFRLPIDRATGKAMTDTAWEKYFADFMTQVRSALPNAEILHNSLWYAGSGAPGSDPYVQQEIRAANWINREGGVSDSGITGNNGYWSIQSLFRFFDTVHSLGANIDIQELGLAGQYPVAAYFLMADGMDAFGSAVHPSQWQSLYDVSLGSPQGDRYDWSGLIRRDYTGGAVLLVPPGNPTVSVSMGSGYTDLSGNTVNKFSLGEKQGAILLKMSPLPPPPVQPPPNPTGQPADGGIYVLTNTLSHLALDVPGASRSAGVAMQQWTPNGTDAQLWKFVSDGTGAFRIKNVSSSLYLEDANGRVVQDWYGNSPTKLWTITPANGGFLIVNKSTGRVIDDSGQSLSPGAAVITWATNGGNNQVWTVQ